MKNYPKVSLCISCYNQEEYIEEAVRSAVSQDYPNYEIIIRDDFSQDNSYTILQALQREFPSKIALHRATQNKGMVENFNELIKLASGDYIIRLDGDDRMLPRCVTTQADYLLKHPKCFVTYPNLRIFDTETDKTICLFINEKRKPRSGDVKQVVKYGCFYSDAFSMVRKDTFPKKPYVGHFPTVLGYIYMIRLLSNKGEIHYIDSILGEYRMHRENVTRGNTILLIRDTLLSALYVSMRYPRLAYYTLYRLYDATISVLTRRNSWL